MLRKKIIIAVLLASALGSCTKNFSTINQNPTSPSSVPLDYLFGQVQLQFAGSAGDPGYTEWRANLIYCMPMIQQMASLGEFYSGDKYLYSATNAASGAYFGTSNGEGNYPNAIKNMVNLLTQERLDSTTNTNLLAMTKILWVMQMSTMTDLYGDIPYFQAGLGYIGQNFTPTYDPQSAIYPDMLNLLSQAAAGLSPSAAIPSAADFAYGGNLTSWQHLAYSLMLRLGMRLQKVDPTDAQKWVTQALAGGVLASNAETYALQYSGGPTYSINANSYNLGPSDGVVRNVVMGGNLQWSNTFINMMLARQDPRIGLISNVGPTTPSGTTLVSMGDTAAADQLGLPNGLDNAPGTTNIDIYSTMNPLTFKSSAPDILFTYAEVEFLKAEAEARGWATGNPATEYALGQAAALNQMVSYNKGYSFTGAQVAAYQAANPYPTTGLADGINAIQTEAWLMWADTYNGYEAYASWRRTGYPVLTPVNYPGNSSNGTIPRRLIYPAEESALDAAAYQTAVTRMGGDLFTVQVWWDGGKD
jgi:Starch-binding associating with outer membrane